jgi:hypothetical protein
VLVETKCFFIKEKKMSAQVTVAQAGATAVYSLGENATPAQVVECAQRCAGAFVKAVLENKESLASQIKTVAQENSNHYDAFKTTYEQSLNNECLQNRRTFNEGFIEKVAAGYFSVGQEEAQKQLSLLSQMQVSSSAFKFVSTRSK